MREGLSRTRFRGQLLDLMTRKHHWAWPKFSSDAVNKDQLKVHFQQEYEVYVRDFPVFLARIYGHNPPASVRAMLAENIYEEDTGRLSLGVSHPELFLKMMKGVGYPRQEFSQIRLLAASRRYRKWLDEISGCGDWIMGAAVLTIFVEGSRNDRREIRAASKPPTKQRLEARVREHPLVRYHRVPARFMDLTRAHLMVENGHRHDAYHMVVNHAVTRRQQEKVLSALRKTLRLWLHYREGIARACLLKQS
ncbi:MAG: iron-containing redox enzyme family protein [Nitrospirales bacterium]|nr:iron-containing redox enzyme family protein [Nitrospira sp.]MDR4502574.1 iron-containing redox enzyme family protein [Nitrospirales bacterium]